MLSSFCYECRDYICVLRVWLSAWPIGMLNRWINQCKEVSQSFSKSITFFFETLKWGSMLWFFLCDDPVTESHWNQFSIEQGASTTRGSHLQVMTEGPWERPVAQQDVQSAWSFTVSRINRVLRSLENSLSLHICICLYEYKVTLKRYTQKTN